MRDGYYDDEDVLDGLEVEAAGECETDYGHEDEDEEYLWDIGLVL